MRPLLHISDLHFGRNDTTTREAKAAIAAIIARWGGDANKPIIVATGDIVQDGEPAQYEIARVEIERLRAAGFEVFLVPGNHDYGRMGSHAEARRFTYFKEAFYPTRLVAYPDVYRIEGWTIVGLNSMKAECGFVDGLLADGELGPDQISDANLVLRQLQEERKSGRTKLVVALHHHPFLFPDESPIKKLGELVGHRLKDGADLMHKITGLTDVLLFGHDHREWDFSKELGGKVLTTDYDIPVILSCGTTSGVNDITQEPGPRKAWLIEEAGGQVRPREITL
ncbi:MAG: metallophosphoesterase [Deltaproteobacteria bacterium]|nr:metallophosphoesterase [Deltaproteobacteria bacterium]